ncbi:appr-1-p processing enzyme family protein [Nannochloropsis gaditana]|uniref:Appr-1-p processing enzyme family protein n=2 Tax=Nannochloropsis gaditana TaxID=72520 RepID=W7TG37_9STRA|nr:appr-1-p processing enzyme family protein [Nannochloropsis gaditana]
MADCGGKAAASILRRSFPLSNRISLQISVGDLTKCSVDAIVNAANERMLGGGGVDGAVHRAAGPQLYEACRAVPEVRPGVRCPTGEARITPGFKLPARYVVHTVGPIYKNDNESAALLRASHLSSLDLAVKQGLTSVAFPAVSCGIYGYPVSRASHIAVKSCIDFGDEQGLNSPLRNIEFVLFSQDIYNAWVAAAEDLVHRSTRTSAENESRGRETSTSSGSASSEVDFDPRTRGEKEKCENADI